MVFDNSKGVATPRLRPSDLKGKYQKFFRMESMTPGALCAFLFLRNQGTCVGSGALTTYVSLHSVEVREAYINLAERFFLEINLVCLV